MRYPDLRSILISTVAVCAIAVAEPALAQTRTFNVPEQAASTGIPELARQADIQILVSENAVRGKTTRAVRGDMTVEAALKRLLRGTGLRVSSSDGRTFTLANELTEGDIGRGKVGPDSVSAEGDTDIVVTGSRIRGGDTPSPVISIGAEQIREEGFSNLGEVIRSVPQNFGGGQNPGVARGSDDRGNQNVTGGSSLNLRGLGPDATLTLLNGRRLSYGGFVQAVDISAIPVEAVERIEIVPDGASAIYGSDAVGGVGNVILRRDFEGLTVGALYGGATDGGLTTNEYTATAGHHWSSGGVIATYKNSSVDPIYAFQRDYTEYMIGPSTIYPGSDLNSVLLSGHQLLTSNIEIRLDALRTDRNGLSFYTDTGQEYHVTTNTKTTLVSPSVEIYLPKNWTLTVGATWGEDKHHQHLVQTSTTTGIYSVVTNDCYCNETRSYEAGAEGALFALPSGDVRLAVGAGYRRNEFRQVNLTTGINTTQGSESTEFAYAELNIPLVGAQQNIIGVKRLVLAGAVRGEHYSSFGSIATPKLGIIYEPNSDFTLKASWGKSFKAPTLYERNYAQYAYLDSPTYYGATGYTADATVLSIDGGNRHLEPERARTWSISMSIHPERLSGLTVEMNYFNIDYKNRVVQPITNYSQALVDPNYADFISYAPTQEDQANIISSSKFYNFTDYSYDPSKVVAVIYAQYINVARQKINGIDFSSSYKFDLGSNHLTLRGSATWLDSSQQTSSTQAPYDLAGVLYNPAKLNGRVGAAWNRGGLSATAFVNYTSGVTDRVNNVKGGSFTTFDATLRYATGHRGGALSGLEFAVVARNLFNKKPPIFTSSSPFYVPYDSTNYSAIGRFLTVSVSKSF